ncbi:histidine kinase [Vibrio navarrensis]|uniref:AraC family transcriptional regulator n=1 Tax=Vibrio navarrensis TaxID=29495 RepID=UPI00186AB877|nr:AraC family transcriptional regulator [Vibrio navarrensis]MBE4592501.1 histidine kinase [Vibrio navarrensis]
MLRILALILFGLVLPWVAQAENGQSVIFYPLPGQEQGTFVAAKNLFIGKEGGLWIHDVHGRVQFYDGNTVLPKKGSLLEFNAEQVAFREGSFWTFVDNEVFQTYPNRKRSLVFSLSPGTQIRKIGSSDQYIWVSDGINFYTYNVENGLLDTYSLLSLYQNNHSSYVYINDAQRVLSKWVLGTTAGAYLSQDKQFTHIKASGKHTVSKLYFSNTRRELLVGTMRGAVLVNIFQPLQQEVTIGDSHVLSISETSQEYWVGTEHGLFSYSFLDGQVTPVQSSAHQGIDLAKRKIYALVNDGSGGIWIATNAGLLYHSLFSRKFERFSPFSDGNASRLTGYIHKALYDSSGGLWLQDGQTLYRMDSERVLIPIHLPGKVNDFAIAHQQVWIATDKGVFIYDIVKQRLRQNEAVAELAGRSVDYVAIDQQGTVWFNGGYRLFALDAVTQQLKDYGDRWIVPTYLPAQILGLEVDTGNRLVVRTDHGAYTLAENKIRFDRSSSVLGESIDIVRAMDETLWLAGSYGLYRKRKGDNTFIELPLPQENVRPACLIPDKEGVWMSSSVGLSFYNFAGELVKHFGEPNGVLSNEFLQGVCASSALNEGALGQLLFGSKEGLLFVNRQELLISKLPPVQAVISQMRVDNQVLVTGYHQSVPELIPYGASVSFMLGVMPVAYNQSLYYRLNQDKWQATEAGQIAFEHLSPGSYQLEVKAAQGNMPGASIHFVVEEPWYLTKVAWLLFAFSSFALVALLFVWRSRYVMAHNRELMAQVALKTNQLRHQSRVLLNSNQQLRKQIQVRNLLVDHVAKSVKSSLNAIVPQSDVLLEGDSRDHLNKIHMQLDELLSSPNGPEENALQQYNLSQVIHSVVAVWFDDLTKAGITVDMSQAQANVRITVDCFNLDVILNSILASVVRRTYRGQTLEIHLREAEQYAELSFIDYGNALPLSLSGDALSSSVGSKTQIDLSIENVPALVAASGGQFSAFIGDARNKLHLCWLKAPEFDYLPAPLLPGMEEMKPPATPELDWLNKVESLVAEHYQDAEFGTAMAAKMLYVSERSLQRRFKSASGRTFKDYLTEVRLERACESLLAGEKIADVAFSSGFNDPSYFSQRFKIHFGLSPSKFATHQQEQD